MSSKRSRNKPRPAGTSPARPAQPPRSSTPARPLAPEEKPGNPNLILAAVIVIALFMGFYYHAMVLRQMHDLVGDITMLDHRFLGYSPADVDALRAAMTGDDLGQLSWVHKTAGLLFTLFTALATALSIGLHGPKRPWRRALYALPVLFVVVALAQNIVVDRLLGRPGDATVGLASTLTVLSWVLLALCTLLVVWLLVSAFVREFRRRWNDPSLQQR